MKQVKTKKELAPMSRTLDRTICSIEVEGTPVTLFIAIVPQMMSGSGSGSCDMFCLGQQCKTQSFFVCFGASAKFIFSDCFVNDSFKFSFGLESLPHHWLPWLPSRLMLQLFLVPKTHLRSFKNKKSDCAKREHFSLHQREK